MLKDTSARSIAQFLTTSFSRVSSGVAQRICETAKIGARGNPKKVGRQEADSLYKAIQETKISAPATDCISPIGESLILKGLHHQLPGEFFCAATRPPAVYRGNPFAIEVGLAYGGELGFDRHDEDPDSATNGKPCEEGDVAARVIRFANRVPLLYQQSSCCLFKSVVDTKWNNYAIPQSSG